MEEWLATLPDGPLTDAVHNGVVDGTILDVTYPIVVVNPGPKQIGLATNEQKMWHFREDGVVELAGNQPIENYYAPLREFLNLEDWSMVRTPTATEPTPQRIIQKLVRG